MKRALITGITGQDGSYLAELLLSKGYEVYGLVRRSSNDPFVRLTEEVINGVHVLYGDLRDIGALNRAMAEAQPDEVYNLAAQSDVGISFKCPEETMEINYYGVGRVMNVAIGVNPNVRVYQASTSEMFGRTNPPQNEVAPFHPVSPYGESKLKAHEDFIAGYRDRHGIYACSGFLFNHESPRRGEHFVTRKITIAMTKIKLGLQDSFQLGNLEAKRDWGYAGDYVVMMWKMLQQDTPDDYVIATGISHTVRDFVEATAQALDMKLFWEGQGLEEVAKNEQGKVILSINEKYYRPNEVDFLLGNTTKAKEKLQWTPDISFDQLVTLMVRADLERFSKRN